jgi:ribosomal protein S12 methylthiotransferase
MRRHINGAQTRELLDRIRREVPGIHIRTTLMVGFPGEGEKEFKELKEFVSEQKFERMGAFAYCCEDDTYAAEHFEDSISDEVKQQRLDEIMALQEEIALESNQSKVGETLTVICDGENDDFFVCRSQYDSPEVDPEVLVRKKDDVKLQKGEFYDVRIVDAMPFELIAEYTK